MKRRIPFKKLFLFTKVKWKTAADVRKRLEIK